MWIKEKDGAYVNLQKAHHIDRDADGDIIVQIRHEAYVLSPDHFAGRDLIGLIDELNRRSE